MADFNFLVSEVKTLTNRPDLVAETILAVKSATLQLHRRDFFAKDLVEVALIYPTSDYLQSIDYRNIFPKYRALKYLRKFDPTNATFPDYGMGPFFKLITPEQVLDSYFQTQTDVCYLAGGNINLRSSTAIQYSAIGIYVNPTVETPETYSSWVADEAPYAVVYTATANLMGAVLRDTAGQNANNALAALEFAEVSNSNITATGS